MPATALRLFARLRPHRSPVLLALTAALVAALAAAAWARLLGPLLEGVLLGKATRIGPWTVDSAALRLQLPLVIIAVAAGKGAAQWLHTGLMRAVGQRVLEQLRRELYDKLLLLPPAWHERQHSGGLLSRFNTDVAAVELSVTTALSSYLKDALTVAALLGVCFNTDWRLAILAFLVMPAMAWPVSRFAKSVKRTALKTQDSLANLTELTAEQLHHLPVVQGYRLETAALERFDSEQHRYLTAMQRSLLIRGAFTPTLELMGIAGVAACLWAGAQAVAQDPALAGSLLTFVASALLMYQPLKGISGTFSEVARGSTSAERLFEILDAPVSESGTESAGPLTQSLQLNDVHLHYPDGRQALRGVTLRFEQGKTTALVGPSGAGKSSVLALILGFTRPTEGELRWDDQPHQRYTVASLRKQLAWVSQEPLLLSGTVAENLRLGAPAATDQDLWRALDRAGATDFVRALPKGLSEDVGERGNRLSGGQRQRLAIARAFLMEPSLLLLDEPTSSLDEGSQREVQQGLAELMRGRTVVVVAHRLSTVADADFVYQLEHGRVLRSGAPADVLPHLEATPAVSPAP